MEETGTPPSVMFAYKRTGLLVTEDNKDIVPPEDLQDWEDAIDLFYAIEDAKGRTDLPDEREWHTEVADFVAVPFTKEHLALVRKHLSAAYSLEASTPMPLVVRMEIAAAHMATALQCAYEAAEEAVQHGSGPDLFDRAQRNIVRRALEIYAQASAGKG